MKLFKRAAVLLGATVICLTLGGSAATTVYAASPGSVGAWTTSPNTMPAAKAYAASTTYNDYVYALGGFGGGPSNNAYYAHLNADGTVGSWTSSGVLPVGATGAGAVAYNGHVYLLGGYTNTYANEVYMATINSSDGSLSNWAATTSMPGGIDDFGVTTHNGYIYVAGGSDGFSDQNKVYYAPINADGTVGSWVTSGDLPTGLTATNAVAYNNYLYVTGGIDTGQATDLVRIAPINNDGSLGSWVVSSNQIPHVVSYHSTAVYHGYMFLAGGYDGGPNDGVYSAPINADGTVGSWATSANNLPQTEYGAAGVEHNGFLYLMGGVHQGALNTVTYAQLDGYPLPGLSPKTSTVTSGASAVVDVLAGATNNASPSSLRIISGPSHGTAAVTAGKITFSPVAGYVGQDSLVYEACSASDSSVCSQATLSFNVLASASSAITAPSTGAGTPSTSNNLWITVIGLAGFVSFAAGLRLLRRPLAR